MNQVSSASNSNSNRVKYLLTRFELKIKPAKFELIKTLFNSPNDHPGAWLASNYRRDQETQSMGFDQINGLYNSRQK